MNCSHCQQKIVKGAYNLKCFECSGRFHLSCIENLTQTDFEFLVSTNASWMCANCKSTKKQKHDETPLTPRGGTSEIESDSSQGSKKDNKVKCLKCNKGFSFNANRAQCSKCEDVLHFKCMDIPKEEYLKVKLTWLCDGCNMQSGASGGADSLSLLTDEKDKIGREDISMAVIFTELKAFRADVNKTHRELEINMNKQSEWLTEHGEKIDVINEKLTAVSSDISFIKQENLNLTKKVADLTARVNSIEQAARENVIEIHGVPYQSEEKIIEIVNKVSTAIGFPFNEQLIDNCYRYKSSTSGGADKPTGIVVRFVRKIDKDLFMEKRRQKRNLNSRDLGYMSGNASVIYVNDSLTPEMRKLFNAARETKRDKQYTYLWVRNGRIYMRKKQGDPFVVIQSHDQLSKLQ